MIFWRIPRQITRVWSNWFASFNARAHTHMHAQSPPLPAPTKHTHMGACTQLNIVALVSALILSVSTGVGGSFEYGEIVEASLVTDYDHAQGLRLESVSLHDRPDAAQRHLPSFYVSLSLD